MLYTARIENKSGDALTLTGNEARWQIISITGLNPPPAQVNTTAIAGMDGAKFNSSKLGTRNIVITMQINGDVEKNRQYLYQFFRTKEYCKFYYQNENRDVFIEGYVETVECNFFTLGETMQVSIICPQPYFMNIDEVVVDISNIIAGFYFPFAIDIGSPIPFSTYEINRTTNVLNKSESETGVIIEIDVESACNEIEIKNVNTGDSIDLQYSFLANDRITINTNPGEKSVKLLREGETINIFSALQKGSKLFQLAVGDNILGYIVDDGDANDSVYIYFNFYARYRGV